MAPTRLTKPTAGIRYAVPPDLAFMPGTLLLTSGPSTPSATSSRLLPSAIRPSVAGFCAIAAAPWSSACEAPPMPVETGP